MNHKRFTQARILIVDDDPVHLRLLQGVLTRAGYARVTSTTEPAESVALVRDAAPDLILLDLHMPDWDGFHVLSRLRKDVPESATVPILMLTGDGDQATRNAALRFGARDFLSKPFNASELLLRVRNLLEVRFLYQDRTHEKHG